MRTIIVILIILFVTGTAGIVYSFRVNRPPTLTEPLTRDQITQLNDFLEAVWYMQNGRFNFDIVTTTKTNAKNGSIWILQTGSTSQIQWKANDSIYTISP